MKQKAASVFLLGILLIVRMDLTSVQLVLGLFLSIGASLQLVAIGLPAEIRSHS